MEKTKTVKKEVSPRKETRRKEEKENKDKSVEKKRKECGEVA